MMKHFAKLKGCIVGKQKEAFQKTRSTLLIHKLLKDLSVYTMQIQTGMPHFLFYIVSTHTFTKQILFPLGNFVGKTIR